MTGNRTRNTIPFINDALEELIENRLYLLLLLLVVLAATVPDIVAYNDDGLYIRKVGVFLAIGLTLLALVHGSTFLAISLALVPVNLIYLHLARHWGAEHLTSRIEAAFESPPDETLEYLQSHVDLIDLVTILFAAVYIGLLIRCAIMATNRTPVLRKIAGVSLIA